MKLCKEEDCWNEKAPGRTLCFSHYGKKRRARQVAVKRYPFAAKILMLDIETTPNLVWTWGIFNANIGVNQIVQPTRMLCFAAQWYGSSEMEFYSEWQHGQEQMVHEAWRLLNEADIVVHFYGSRFDVLHLNREFLQTGLTPPRPFKQVDLKLAVSKRFKFTSNKLQFVSEVLGLEGKEEHEGFRLWSKVMAGDKDAQARMESYNRRDTTLLREVYEILLPWIPNLPNKRLYEGSGGCPNCGELQHLVEDGYYYTAISKFRQFVCRDCGSWFRSSKREMGSEIRGTML